ncbi:ring-1,2-phenylacetyl-CoA epoxidase subunit PaaC [Streptomyces zhaozhouensis]|uniref:Ring-1,2-phenylacetyl-CoA epoxidase subunit PaaC n=1 Tax=Streptomyces zhaozhouensis TaxID=1300267 RepID=A0A286DW05_9ACTN|nr:1,2-phenylacetyl-CoA epoxidase subunit PaaC [Streptomyces zhaozhouensis]SOD62800.1 ring-1,2-phenylacetyl-CoA epoxidase subunit PaaC [Streptomyces zhaozhouensis]
MNGTGGEGDGPGDARWAFGTGFEDPLHGVAVEPPPGADGAAVARVCVALADDALVGAQRLAEWVTCAPELEIELALANVGLDLLGQARLLYARAGQVDGSGRGEDDFAYRRAAAEFRCLRLAELPRGDFAFTALRMLALSSARLAVLDGLRGAADPVLAAVAERGVTEVTYHRLFAAEWVVRLGDGTDVSRGRLGRAVEEAGPWLAEVWDDAVGAELGVAPGAVRAACAADWGRVAREAGVPLPVPVPVGGSGGRAGVHTAHLPVLLAELQGVARAHPGASW